MKEKEINGKIEMIEHNLWDFYRNSEVLLKYSEIYLIINLIKNIVNKNKEIEELKK